MTAPPDPTTEIRITALQSLRGMNFWSVRPVTRMDLAVGAFDEISSAQVAGFTDALVKAMPGLVEHRCSIGTRGGFVTRLRRGTYAPHIIEHVALELQSMVGHDVGYGKTRGGDVAGEYTLVFEHKHAGVGLRAAALALDTVQRAFAGTLDTVDAAVAEMKALAESEDVPPLRQDVLCGVTGGGPRGETRDELVRRGGELGLAGEVVVDVAPAYVLQAGLPYSRSEMAIILDAEPADVPERYQDPERARQLVSTLIDAVPRDGVVIVPAKEWELQDAARDADCRVAIFAPDDDVTWRDKKLAHAIASVADGRIVLECGGDCRAEAELRADLSPAAQAAAALAVFALQQLR
jgi:hypothetical protein